MHLGCGKSVSHSTLVRRRRDVEAVEIAYLFESILNLAPQVAAQLSRGIGMMSSPGGGNYAPSISTGGVSAVPGKGHLQAGRQALKQASEGGFNIADAIRGMLGIR